MPIKIPFLHSFQKDISEIQFPEKFTFPFCYDPHPLSMIAAEQVQYYLQQQTDFQHNFGLNPNQDGLVIGKMFGVLVVKDNHNNIGFLAAVSGKLAGTNQHSYFVPPIFDMLSPTGFFLKEEENINRINREIENLTNSKILEDARENLISTKKSTRTNLSKP
jgi:tRNA pseudouridine32 synthase/23S rRNA pseudouridine746 synthase